MNIDGYDALTLELEKSDVLARHIEDRLSNLVSDADDGPELYALSLVAAAIRDRNRELRERARQLFTTQVTAEVS